MLICMRGIHISRKPIENELPVQMYTPKTFFLGRVGQWIRVRINGLHFAICKAAGKMSSKLRNSYYKFSIAVLKPSLHSENYWEVNMVQQF